MEKKTGRIVIKKKKKMEEREKKKKGRKNSVPTAQGMLCAVIRRINC